MPTRRSQRPAPAGALAHAPTTAHAPAPAGALVPASALALALAHALVAAASPRSPRSATLCTVSA